MSSNAHASFVNTRAVRCLQRTRKVKRMVSTEFSQSHESQRAENLAMSKDDRKRQGFLF